MVISLVVVLVLILFVAAIIIGLANISKNGKEEAGMVNKVYVYLVLFATLMMIIGGSVSAFMAVADLAAPTPYYQSFEEFSNWRVDKPTVDAEGKPEKYTAEELDTMYKAMVQSEADRQKARAYNTLFKSFGWIIIPLPVFIYYQKRLAKV